MTITESIRKGLASFTGIEMGDEHLVEELEEAEHKCESSCCPSYPVTEMEVGDAGIVSCLTDPAHPRAARLAALGVLPGVPLRLVQSYPAYVVRLGFAELALDGELARLVRVITGKGIAGR